jgi:hypothetical protein
MVITVAVEIDHNYNTWCEHTMVRFGTTIFATKFYIQGNSCECILVANEGLDREGSWRFGNLPFEIADLQICDETTHTTIFP